MANLLSLPVRRPSRARHFACLPLRNNPLEEPEKYFNLKIILGNPKDWAKTGDAGKKALTKGVFGRKVLRQSIADLSVEASHVPPGTITQHRQCAQGTATRETMMNVTIKTLGLAAAVGLAAAPAMAQEKVKVGLLLTLSGPSAVLGQHARDGFQLAVKDLGGKLGGRDVEVIVVDDELKPDVAVTKVKGLLERDKVDFVVGPIFSNVAVATQKPITDAKTFYISVNAGPSNLAGKSCSPYFFATSYQNDQNHEVLGKVAQDRGYKKVYLLAPNYQAGKDALAGFKRHYKGEIVEESYTPLNTLDFQSELAKIASMQPDAIFTFMPGGMGVNLVKQYRAAGLADRIPFLSAFTVDETNLPAQQDAAIGMLSGSNWAPNMDTPENKKFVAAFEAAYNAVPASYAMHSYDAALLIDSALKTTGGKTDDKEALRAAIKKAEFKSLRGDFKFGANGFPVQDFYLVKAAKRQDGKLETQIVEKVFDDYTDAYAKECAATN